MQCPKAVIFDLDNTLAESFQPPAASMAKRLERVIALMPTAIMSAASLERICDHVLPQLSSAVDLSRLTLFTSNAAQCYSRSGCAWHPLYQYGFSEEERALIQSALKKSVEETAVDKDTKQHGEQFVYYDGYIAYTAVGVDAPREEKLAWDPDAAKRNKLRLSLQDKLPQFDVYIGGATSVDVTPKGINKAFGVRAYATQLHLTPAEMLFVGDALYEGGNDQIVIGTGIATRQVSGPSETEQVIDELLALCTAQ